MKNIRICKFQEIKTMPYNSKLIHSEKVTDYGEKNTIKNYEVWQSNSNPKIKYTIEYEEEIKGKNYE